MSEKPDPSPASTAVVTAVTEEPAPADAVPLGIRASTIATIQNLRFGDVPYGAAARRLEDVLKEDPVLGHELREVERKVLIDALLDENHRDTPATEIIDDTLSGQVQLGVEEDDSRT